MSLPLKKLQLRHDDNVEESMLDLKPTTSHSEAMLSKCIEWLETQEKVNAMQVLLICKIRNITIRKIQASKSR